MRRDIVECRRCRRLADHCQTVAKTKRRAYRHWNYWGKPVPSFGDPSARLLVVGLAPGAHGANRTGRVFTGDSSGEFLFRALYDAGLASQPSSEHRNDGLTLKDCYVTCAVRCAPPKNRPVAEEFASCRPFLERELELLQRLRVAITLGHLAHRALLAALRPRGLQLPAKKLAFGHGRHHRLPGHLPDLVSCYHPSRQNTQTGRLTMPMLMSVLHAARALL